MLTFFVACSQAWNGSAGFLLKQTNETNLSASVYNADGTMCGEECAYTLADDSKVKSNLEVNNSEKAHGIEYSSKGLDCLILGSLSNQVKCITNSKPEEEQAIIKTLEEISNLQGTLQTSHSSVGTWLAIIDLRNCSHSPDLCFILMPSNHQNLERSDHFPPTCFFITALLESCNLLRSYSNSCASISYFFKITTALGDIVDVNINSDLALFCNSTNNACDWMCADITNKGKDSVKIVSLGMDRLLAGECIDSAVSFFLVLLCHYTSLHIHF